MKKKTARKIPIEYRELAKQIQSSITVFFSFQKVIDNDQRIDVLIRWPSLNTLAKLSNSAQRKLFTLKNVEKKSGNRM